MTTVDVRPMRIWERVLVGLLAGSATFGLALAAIFGPNLLLGIFVLVLVGLEIRIARLRCWVEGDVLHVREILRTAAYSRSEIIGFHVEDLFEGGDRGLSVGRRRTVYVNTVDGKSHALRATDRGYYSWRGRSREGMQNRADEYCAQLEAWRISP